MLLVTCRLALSAHWRFGDWAGAGAADLRRCVFQEAEPSRSSWCKAKEKKQERKYKAFPAKHTQKNKKNSGSRAAENAASVAEPSNNDAFAAGLPPPSFVSTGERRRGKKEEEGKKRVGDKQRL